MNYEAYINYANNYFPPVFCELEPNSGDTTKVRLNGLPADLSTLSLGTFDVGAPLTVIARPVMSISCESYQSAAPTLQSALYYTTTPGDWSNMQSVIGTFVSSHL